MAKKTSKRKSNLSRTSKPLRRNIPFSGGRLLVFIIIFAAVGGYVLWKSFAAPRTSASPFAVTETFSNRNLLDNCVSEDDNLMIVGNKGYLNPGESFTYTTKTGDCNNDRAIWMDMTWGTNTKSTKSQLQLTSVVPLSERWTSYGGTYYLAENDAGKVIEATYSGAKAQLCMFSAFGNTTPTTYSFTIKNLSTSKVSNIAFLSSDDNDWPDEWNRCSTTDADHDGFSDAFEHYKAYMSQGGHLGQPWSPPVGTNYLRACGTPAADDEFDAWPPDANDDNAVTQADVDIAQSYLGQGDGHNWVGINITPGFYDLSTGAWRRFDLNTDGYVTSADVDIVKNYLGKSCQAA